ncbi:MAG: DNA polymerase IV, partial [Clostridiaceae bacterium]|nr:DNA polymerase IV [Clostridiaceae bacterium]
PSLRGKAVAVCGSTEDRHGIVLAKSELAKKSGVKTGMVNFDAKRLCPQLIVVPPQYEQYLKYSALVRDIYARYTDQIEPFGMDECWLDVSGSRKLFGDGMKIAETIRRTVKEELGLTISIGVSFNKVFAKLGSDLKKPDAITEITQENFKEKVWPLPASEMIYVGRATEKKLAGYGIHTIGDVAQTDPDNLKRWFGKCGLAIWVYARGLDESRVMHKDFVSPVKSLGHGITCVEDLKNDDEVWKVMLELSQDIGHRLRVHKLLAGGVQITAKSNDLSYRQYQVQFSGATRSAQTIAEAAHKLFVKQYDWYKPVRAVTIRAINLLPYGNPQQLDLFTDPVKLERRDQFENTIEDIRRRFGNKAVTFASLMGDLKMPGRDMHEVIMPNIMYQ